MSKKNSKNGTGQSAGHCTLEQAAKRWAATPPSPTAAEMFELGKKVGVEFALDESKPSDLLRLKAARRRLMDGMTLEDLEDTMRGIDYPLLPDDGLRMPDGTKVDFSEVMESEKFTQGFVTGALSQLEPIQDAVARLEFIRAGKPKS